MKIQKDKLYQIKLSGDQILLIQELISNSPRLNALSIQGNSDGDDLYNLLEYHSELVEEQS
jgi:hypothetical protein